MSPSIKSLIHFPPTNVYCWLWAMYYTKFMGEQTEAKDTPCLKWDSLIWGSKLTNIKVTVQATWAKCCFGVSLLWTFLSIGTFTPVQHMNFSNFTIFHHFPLKETIIITVITSSSYHKAAKVNIYITLGSLQITLIYRVQYK